MPVICHIIVLCLAIMAATAWGQDSQISALSFHTWKEQQVLEAQNQMLRVSSRINQLKSSKGTLGSNKDSAVSLPNNRIKKAAETDSLAAAERDLKRAQETLESAGGLQLDDYINIYLPTLQDNPDALNKLADKLSKEELAEIFKMTYLKKDRDTKRNSVSSLERSRSKGL